MKLIIKTLLLVILSSPILFANGLNKNLPLNGLGFSIEYDHDKESDIIGYNLAYKYGFFQVFSAFFSADIGYKSQEKALSAKTGCEVLFLFVGFETGFAMLYNTRDTAKHSQGDIAPGMYIGLSGGLPGNQHSTFISFGGNFYFQNHSPQFYAKLTLLLNFAK